MSDIGVDVFAEWGVVPEDVVPLPSVEFSGNQFRRVLFGMGERLGRMLFCPMKRMTTGC